MKNLITLIFLASTTLYAQDYTINKPRKNFDYLWKEFNDRYAFFELKNINWDKVYDKYSPLVNDETTNDSLFTVCNKMLNELRDGHVNLTMSNGKYFRESVDAVPSTLFSKFPVDKDANPNIYQLLEATRSTLNENGFKEFKVSKSGLLSYGTSDDYGYLLISAMQGFKIGELRRFITMAVKDFESRKGVIIDIRVNGGGRDFNALDIAGRFTDKKRVAFHKKQRIKGTNEYTSLKTRCIKPQGKRQFTNPIVVLTSDYTASAADVFALAIRELPYATIVGDHTQGIFSDMYNFSMPNRWKVTLSHQQYFSSQMINYEGVGVEPDVLLLNEPEDISSGADSLIIKAIEQLNSKTTPN